MTAQVAVVGAGRMGVGIAATYLAAGHDVTLVDIAERTPAGAHAHRAQVRARLDEAEAAIGSGSVAGGSVAGGSVAGGSVAGGSVAGGSDRGAGAVPGVGAMGVAKLADREADLRTMSVIFEAVPETVEAKRAAFAWLGEHAASSAALASTTSGFLVTEVAAMAADPTRVVNAHWLNPAHLIPLVEVSSSEQTDPEAVARVTAMLESVGKIPVRCAPSAGYIVPRLQALVMNEAARMVEEGVASAADIDRAVRAGFGPRFAVLGPLEFIDWGGGDILCHVSRYLAARLGERFAAPESVERNQTENRRGLRDGAGFYDYSSDPDAIAEYRSARLREFEEIFALRLPHLRSGTAVPTRTEP